MIRLRPLVEADLALLGRFAVEPGLIGLDWAGFRDPQAAVRRWGEDGYLGPDGGRLMVEFTGDPQGGNEAEVAGFVGWQAGSYGGAATYWEIGIALLPAYRGRGIGWRAQATLCDDLFRHTPAYRIQAGTHPENVAEQRALTRAGFQLEGVIRGCEFRAGRWRDGLLYSRLRDDPAPPLG
jgi:ribosomal-protein-alanine N-acetyltransferase